MELRRDPRWEEDWLWPGGAPTLEELTSRAESLRAMVPENAPDLGPLQLLRTARSLFVHSLYDRDFMPVAVLIGYQAVEAAFRWAYSQPPHASFETLIKRAHADGYLSSDGKEWADFFREMRNMLSHPLGREHEYALGATRTLSRAHEMVVMILKATCFDWPKETAVPPPPPGFVIKRSETYVTRLGPPCSPSS